MKTSHLTFGVLLASVILSANIDNKAQTDYTLQHGMPANVFLLYFEQINKQFVDYNVSLEYLQAVKGENNQDLFKIVFKLSSKDDLKSFFAGFTVLSANDPKAPNIVLKTGYSGKRDDVLALNGIKDFQVQATIPDVSIKPEEPKAVVARLLEDIANGQADIQTSGQLQADVATVNPDVLSQNMREVHDLIQSINDQFLVADINDQMLVADINNQMFNHPDPVDPNPTSVSLPITSSARLLEDIIPPVQQTNKSPNTNTSSTGSVANLDITAELATFTVDQLQMLERQVEAALLSLSADPSVLALPAAPQNPQVDAPNTNSITDALNASMQAASYPPQNAQQNYQVLSHSLLEDDWYSY